MPLPFVFPYALVFWLVYIWAYAPEMRIVHRAGRGASAPGSRDAGSMRVIMMGMGLASAAAFPLAWVTALRVPAPLQAGVFVVGMALLISGSLLRRHCWRQLGKYFTGNVAAQVGQPVVTTGAYAWVRHPSYTAGTMMNVGIGLALGSWASAGLLLVASLAVYDYRMKVEERVLLETLGEPYRQYIAGRKRIIPFVH